MNAVTYDADPSTSRIHNLYVDNVPVINYFIRMIYSVFSLCSVNKFNKSVTIYTDKTIIFMVSVSLALS